MSIFKSLTDLASDVFDIASAPVKIAVDTTRVVTAPIAKVAKEVSDEIGEMVDEVTEDFKNDYQKRK